MGNYGTKIKHIVPTYLLIAVGSGILLFGGRWVLDFYLGIGLKVETWEIWIPMIFPWIPMTIWLRPRLRILKFGQGTDGSLLLQTIAWFAFVGFLVIGEMYLTKANGTLIHAKHLAELNVLPETKYLVIDSFEVDTSRMIGAPVFRSSGKYNEHLNMSLYMAVPMVGDNVTGNRKYFFGLLYKEQISSRLSNEEKERKYKAFVDVSLGKFKRTNYHEYTYLERLGPSEDLDEYENILRDQGLSGSSAVLLIPKTEPFESRTGNKLIWSFGVFLIGTMLFLLVLLWPNLDQAEYERQLAGVHQREDDIVLMLSFLIPREPHITTSILLDLNLLVFVLMISSGVHFINPNVPELLPWGAVRRHEVMHGEYWRMFTCMFVHAGLQHIVLNGVGLILAGIYIEPILGWKRSLIVFLLSGIGCSALSIWWHTNTVSVGASGAILGWFGAILVLLLTKAIPQEMKRFTLVLFGGYVVVTLLVGFVGIGDNAGHLGGLITGALIALTLYEATGGSESGEET